MGTMSITKKILIALGICVLSSGLFLSALLLIILPRKSEKELAREAEPHEIEGRQFGKTTDQEGCMKEGLTRAKSIPLQNLSRNLSNLWFVRACLKSSRPTARFCSGIPRDSLFHASAEYDWEVQQCEDIGMNTSETGCIVVFTARANYCNDDR